jgi:membrane-bound ClpP family serine protease
VSNWSDLSEEIKKAGTVFDLVRRKYLMELHKLTGRNVIIYYSGWLQKPDWHGQGGIRIDINDSDKDSFMATIHQLDRKKGLDLFLHTPGGDVAATESLGDYLRSMFHGDIRAIVPQLAMSGGTMIACACKEIVMGKHSSLGAIDPQLHGLAAHGVIEEFNTASKEITKDPSKIPLWQPIIAKYHPTLIGECQKAIDWSKEMVKEWLVTGMLKNESAAKTMANKIIKELGDHALTKSHARHISQKRAHEIGLKIVDLESDQALQDAVLSIHHCCIHTLASTQVFKIVENHNGVAVNGVAAPA